MQFISERVIPAPGTADLRALARREPGLPTVFTWRRKSYVIAALLETWKTLDRPGPHAYVRRHWFRVRTTSDAVMTLYCERQTRNRRRPKACWWLYTTDVED